MFKRLLCVAAAIALTACANPYAQYYSDRTGGQDVAKMPGVIISKNPPTIMRGGDPEADYQTMVSEGFRLIGFSSFNGKEASEYQVRQQAEAVKAERVLVYAKYSSTEHSAVPVSMPNTATATTNYYGASGFGTATTTMTGTTTTMVPVSVRRYDQSASFWVRGTPTPVFGADMRELTPQQRSSLQTNKGVTIIAIQKGTPAYNADLLPGDVLKAIGGKEVTDFRGAVAILTEAAGTRVTVEFIRNGNLLRKDVTLNPYQKPPTQ